MILQIIIINSNCIKKKMDGIKFVRKASQTLKPTAWLQR